MPKATPSDTQEEKDYWTIRAMRVYGGSFVQALAELAIHADPENLSRIKKAWPEYWKNYEEMGQQGEGEKVKE